MDPATNTSICIPFLEWCVAKLHSFCFVTLSFLFSFQVLKKRKYLCATDYDEKYFDWHCLPGGEAPSFGATWYTVCGVALPNKVEFIVFPALICLIATVVFGNLHFGSYGDSVFDGKNSGVNEGAKKKKVKKN